MCKVSVVIPTFNRQKKVIRAIKSVLHQDYNEIEVIIVDDCSTDETKEKVISLKSNRIKYFRHSENKGVAKAQNTGIERATGDYIAFLDSDDEWLDAKLSKQLQCFEASVRNIGLVYTQRYTIDEYKGVKYMDSEHNLSANKIHNGNVTRELMRGWGPTPSSILVPSKVFQKVGMFKPEMADYTEQELFVRLSQYYEFLGLPEPLMVRYIHTGSQLGQNPELRHKGCKAFVEEWRDEMNELLGREQVDRFITRELSKIRARKAKILISNNEKVEAVMASLKCIKDVGHIGVFTLVGLIVGSVMGSTAYKYLQSIWKKYRYEY